MLKRWILIVAAFSAAGLSAGAAMAQEGLSLPSAGTAIKKV
jgi:hypothetical protein